MGRRLAPLPQAAALLSLLLAPLVGAHPDGEAPAAVDGDHLRHIDVWETWLAPGGRAERTMTFGDGIPLSEGWFLVVQGEVEGHVRVRVQDDADAWGWDWGPGRHNGTLRLRHAGYPVLSLENIGPGDATVRLYYDHTCDCLGKSVRLAAGAVVFPVPADPGQRMDFAVRLVPVRGTFDTPEGTWDEPLRIRIALLDAHEDGSYDTERTWTWTYLPGDEDCEGLERFAACVSARFTAAPRQVVWVEVEHRSKGWAIQVRPTPSVHDAPGLPLAALAGGVLAATLFAAVRGRP